MKRHTTSQRVGRLCRPYKSFVELACACTHLIFEERCHWRDDPKPEASPDQPEIIRLQLCDRLKDSHRFVSVFWILAKPIQYCWFGSQAPTAGRTTPATHNARISFGATFCDCKPVGDGVWEMRIDHGPGYRVYYALSGKRLVLLLAGGDKRKQQADIDAAVGRWKDWQQRRKPT